MSAMAGERPHVRESPNRRATTADKRQRSMGEIVFVRVKELDDVCLFEPRVIYEEKRGRVEHVLQAQTFEGVIAGKIKEANIC